MRLVGLAIALSALLETCDASQLRHPCFASGHKGNLFARQSQNPGAGGGGEEEPQENRSSLRKMIEGALDAAMKGKSSSKAADDDSSDITIVEEGAAADLMQDELDRARRILAKNARRVIQLEEQKKRMTGTTSDGAQASEAPEKDGGEMSDNETLAFQIGFNSIEYVTGSGTVTVSRQGTKTVLTVDSEMGASSWVQQIAAFIKARVSSSGDTSDERTPEPSPPTEKSTQEQAPKLKEATERLDDVTRVWRAWYGNAAQPWGGGPAGRSFPPPGRDVTGQVNANLRISNGQKYLLVKRPFNQEFGDPFFGLAKGLNQTASFAEKVVVREGSELGDAEDSRNKEVRSVTDSGVKPKDPAIKTDPEAEASPFGEQSWWNKVPWYNGTQTLVPGVTPDAVAPEAKKAVKNEEPRAPQSPAPKAKVDKTKKPPPVIPFLKYSSPGPPKSEWTREDCSKPAFRILSLDGGGVRGALTTVILQRIIAEVPTFMDNVDLIAGTSTGGLIGLMLAAGYSPAECQDIYEYGCPKIFSKDKWRVYNPTNAKYTAQGREELCRTYLGDDRTLADLNKHVVITAFRLDGKVGKMGAFISRNGGWRPAVFSNIPKLKGDLEPDLNLYAWDAALRTSAAPTYFPVHRGYVDGAMFQNNPSMLAVTKACAHFPRVSPENCVVLSVGAGNFPMSIPQAAFEDLDWGIKDWVPYIFDLMMDGDSLSSEVLMRYMLGDRPGTGGKRYHRIDPQISKYVDLDDVEAIPEMIEIAKRVDLNETIKFVQQHFSSTPSASDAFAQAAVRTASWAGQQAAKVQLSDVVRSLTAAPQPVNIPWMGTSVKLPDFPDFPGFTRPGGTGKTEAEQGDEHGASKRTEKREGGIHLDYEDQPNAEEEEGPGSGNKAK